MIRFNFTGILLHGGYILTRHVRTVRGCTVQLTLYILVKLFFSFNLNKKQVD
jgi:hypothetical protein